MTEDTPGTPSPIVHRGGCHCGRVRFEVDAPRSTEVLDCNCSICAKSGFLPLIVPRERFRLLTGADDPATCSFNTGAARHHFCRHCGIKSWYVPRSHPDGIDVNARCLDAGTVLRQVITPFDGRRWEASVGAPSR